MIFKVPKKLGEEEGRHLETLNYFYVFNKVSALQFNNLKLEKGQKNRNGILVHHTIFSLSKTRRGYSREKKIMTNNFRKF